MIILGSLKEKYIKKIRIYNLMFINIVWLFGV